MLCQCGFTNEANAKFCGHCGLPMEDKRQGARADPSASLPTSPLTSVMQPKGKRGVSVGIKGLVVLVAIGAAAGYWWLNQPPGPFKQDNSGLFIIGASGKYGFMDGSGKIIITPQFEEVGEFSEGFATVLIGDKFGYINTKGEVAITPQFDYAESFRNGRAAVKLCCGPDYWSDGERLTFDGAEKSSYGFIDTNGKLIGTPDLLWVAKWFSGEFAPVKTGDGRYGIMNRVGKVEYRGNFERVSDFGFAEGVAAGSTGGKWGYFDTLGEWVIDPQFEAAQSFSDGLAAVKVGGKWGSVDREGKFVVNPQF